MKLINKKAKFNYQTLEEFEAGIVLTGAEVKAIRRNSVDFTGSHVLIHENEAYVTNLHIGVDGDTDSRKKRKLLLHKAEIAELKAKKESQGLTIIPVSLYNKRSLVGSAGKRSTIKIKIALVRGRKSHDKRDYKKSQDIKRDLDRELKNYS